MVNHLETVFGPSVVHKLSSIFKTTPNTSPPPEASGDPTEEFPAGIRQVMKLLVAFLPMNGVFRGGNPQLT